MFLPFESFWFGENSRSKRGLEGSQERMWLFEVGVMSGIRKATECRVWERSLHLLHERRVLCVELTAEQMDGHRERRERRPAGGLAARAELFDDTSHVFLLLLLSPNRELLHECVVTLHTLEEWGLVPRLEKGRESLLDDRLGALCVDRCTSLSFYRVIEAWLAALDDQSRARCRGLGCSVKGQPSAHRVANPDTR